jgi:endonuclease/exonuclease/phosphatase family metal-dependent hydrolase
MLLSACHSSNYRPEQLRATPHELSVMSLNVHYYRPGADKSEWQRRKYAVTAALREMQPDIVLFQEMETFEGGHMPRRNEQLRWVLERVEGYAAGALGAGKPVEYLGRKRRTEGTGPGRSTTDAARATEAGLRTAGLDSGTFPVTQPILYRPARFALVEEGFFFFSSTPDEIYSQPWAGSWPAYTSWLLLRERSTGRLLYLYNSHLDAFSGENRRKGSRLIRRRIAERSIRTAAVVLGGDFNALPGWRLLATIEEAGLRRVPIKSATYHFRRGLELFPAIDHLFHSPALKPVSYGVVQQKWAEHWPSDHHPIVAAFDWE